MRIGVDLRALTAPHRTGVAEFIVEFLTAVFATDRTHEYVLFYNAAGDAPALPTWEQPNVTYVVSRIPNRLLNAGLLLLHQPKLDRLIERSTLKTKALDIFFSPNFNYLAISPRVIQVLLVHDISFHFFPFFFTPRQRLWHRWLGPQRQCERANLILAPSENTKRDVLERYLIPEKKIRVLSPGLSPLFGAQPLPEQTRAVQKKYGLPDRFVLFLGSIEPRKNIPAVIAGFELYRQTATDQKSAALHLVIAGAPGWKNAEVYTRAKRSPYAGDIHCIGYVAPEDKPALYRLAEVFVYPSFYEGFGFPALEAMASGVPVITSARSSLPEITGAAAWLINPHRPEEIAAGLAALLPPGSARAAAIQRGRAAAERFSWQQTAQTWQNIVATAAA